MVVFSCTPIAAAAAPNILRSVAVHGGTPSQAAKKEGLEKLSEREVQAIIDDLIIQNHKLIEERGRGAMGPLMGKAMAKLQGKPDGKLVNKLLREKIDKNNK